jgi:glycosyltransferase involved in cell wall biosynthesis
MKIIFIDHEFHKKTKSSDFFVNVISDFFDLERVYLDPLDPISFDVIQNFPKCNVVILWQMDFLAPIFLAQGIPTIVIPMYDGSANMPDLHWLWSRKASYINFSRRLHDHISWFGQRSFLTRYFPEPPLYCDTTPERYNESRVFFWQRRPADGLNLRFAEDLLGRDAVSIHVHDVADDHSLDTSVYLEPSLSNYELTVSRWSKDPTDYAKLLPKANVFLAPRFSEGIGLAFLEAMAHGLVVVAIDGPTHDEYIRNWYNGILFNKELHSSIDLGGADNRQGLGKRARETALIGYDSWVAQIPKLIEFIRVVASQSLKPLAVDAAELAQGLIKAYYAGQDTYKAYLVRNISLLESQAGVSLYGKLTDNFDYSPSQKPMRKPFEKGLRPATEQKPWLQNQRLDEENGVDENLIVAGSVRKENQTIWLATQQVVYGFRLDWRTGTVRKLRAHFKTSEACEATNYCITLNGHTLGFGNIGKSEEVVEFEIPLNAVHLNDNELLLQTDAINLQGQGVGFTCLEFV